MEPEQLSEEVLRVVEKAQGRVGPGSIGAQQYHTPGKPQKFETMTMVEFFDYYEEEALDIVTYGVMLSIKIDRLREVWKRVERLTYKPDQPAEDGSDSDTVPFGASAFTPSSGLHSVLPGSEFTTGVVPDVGQRGSGEDTTPTE